MLAELSALASWTWVSRDAEVPLVAATLVVALEVGAALGRELATRPVRPSLVLGVVTFLFAWGFVQRLGVQLGLDFTHFDCGAGAFRDAGASFSRVAAAVVYKHLVPRALLYAAVLAPLAPAWRGPVARGALVAELARAATLLVALYVERHSFWVAMRAIGDEPHALMAVLVAAGAWAVGTWPGGASAGLTAPAAPPPPSAPRSRTPVAADSRCG